MNEFSKQERKGIRLATMLLIVALIITCPMIALATEEASSAASTGGSSAIQTAPSGAPSESAPAASPVTTPTEAPPGTQGDPPGGSSTPPATPAPGDTTPAAPVVTPPAPPVTPPAEVKPTVPPDTTRTQGDYEIPAGSAYIEGGDGTVYENSATENAIQQALNAAMAAATNSITIVVNNGVYAGGITVIAPAEPDEAGQGAAGAAGAAAGTAESLILKIIAHDAYTTTTDADGNVTDTVYNAQSAGGVGVEGDLNFNYKDIQLLLAGIYLSMQNKVNVEDAKSVEYYGTKVKDDVDLTLNNVGDKIKIDMGAGDDKLNATVTQSPTVTIDINSDGVAVVGDTLTDSGIKLIEDGIKAGIEKLVTGGATTKPDVRLEVSIAGGSGNDEITLKLVNNTALTVTTEGGAEGGKAGTTINGAKIDLDLSATDVKIDAGEGADTVNVKGGMKLGLATIAAQPILNALSTALTKASENSKIWDTTLLPQTQIAIDGALGDDTANIDTTVAFSSYRGVTVNVNGCAALDATGSTVTESEAGFDRTHITGKIGDSYMIAGDDRISGTKENVTMSALAEITILNNAAAVSKLYATLGINMKNNDALSDALKGKNIVEGTIDQLNDETFKSFTDYVVKEYDKSKDIKNTTGQDTLLTNLIIKGDQLDIGNIETPNINILLSSDNNLPNSSSSVTVSGNVIGKNILLSAEKSDSHALTLVENDLGDEQDDYKLEASLFDALSDAVITIAEGASLRASEAIALKAASEQTRPLIPTLEELTQNIPGFDPAALNINFVSVKVGSAIIKILGSMNSASLKANATSNVDVSATNKNLASFGLPLAIGVVVAEAGVLVDKNATINASEGGIYLNADSSIKLETEARSGKLPFTLAVSTVVNDAYVDVKGSSSLDAKGDINLCADGYTNIKTISTGVDTTGTAVKPGTPGTTPAKAPSNSGGFFAVSVGVQNVYATIRENASAAAGESLKVASDAIEQVT
ncbi:MAG: hypothetical protein RR361_00710, partial [Anaerovorax sp.]